MNTQRPWLSLQGTARCPNGFELSTVPTIKTRHVPSLLWIVAEDAAFEALKKERYELWSCLEGSVESSCGHVRAVRESLHFRAQCPGSNSSKGIAVAAHYLARKP